MAAFCTWGTGIRACFRAAPSSNFVGITRTPVPVQHPKLRAPRHKCQSSREDSTRLANFIKDVIDVFLASVLAFLLLALVFLDRGLELALRGIRAVGVLGLAVFLSLYQFFVEAKQNTGELKKLDEAKQEEQQSKAEDKEFVKGCTDCTE